MDIARERLFKYINKCLNDYILPLGIEEVDLVFTGDLVNLDERLDQLLTNQYGRAETTIRAFDILSEVIEYLLDKELYINAHGVVGNESRVKAHEYFSSVDPRSASV